MIKHSHPWRKGFTWLVLPNYSEGSQGRNYRQEPEAIENATYWLAPQGLTHTVCFLIQLRTTCPGLTLPAPLSHLGWALPQKSPIKKMPQTCLRPTGWKQFLKFTFSRLVWLVSVWQTIRTAPATLWTALLYSTVNTPHVPLTNFIISNLVRFIFIIFNSVSMCLCGYCAHSCRCLQRPGHRPPRAGLMSRWVTWIGLKTKLQPSAPTNGLYH